MTDELEIKFQDLVLNVDTEHDLAFIHEMLLDEANGVPIDDDVHGLMLDLCYSKARNIILEAKKFATLAERQNVEIEDLAICNLDKADVRNALLRLKKLRNVVNKQPIIVPTNEDGMILPSWRNCQIGAEANLKGCEKTAANIEEENRLLDEELANLKKLEMEKALLMDMSSGSSSTGTGDSTDHEDETASKEDSRKVPSSPKIKKKEETPPPNPARKKKRSSGRSPSSLSAATASALEMALRRRPPTKIEPPPKIEKAEKPKNGEKVGKVEKASRSKPKKPKLNANATKSSEGEAGGGSTKGGEGGGAASTKSKSKSTKPSAKPVTVSPKKSPNMSPNIDNSCDQPDTEQPQLPKINIVYKSSKYERPKQEETPKNEVTKPNPPTSSASTKNVGKEKPKPKATPAKTGPAKSRGGGKTAAQSNKKSNATSGSTPKDTTVKNPVNNHNPPPEGTTATSSSSSGQFRLPKINIIQNFKRDPRGSRARKKK